MTSPQRAEWPPPDFELCEGPQDGARVMRIGYVMPQTIYVGRKWMGDAYVAWGQEQSDRFPVCYVMSGYKFKYKPEKRK